MDAPSGPAAVDATAHVLVDGALDDELVVDGPDGHHLQRVRRVRPGEVVTAADGRGAWRTYVVARADRAALHLEATGPPAAEPRPRPPIALLFAVTKGDGPETVVARATELGVDRFEPVVTDRTVARPDPDRLAARLHRVAREATMQSRRAWLPELAPVRPLGAVLAELRGDSGHTAGSGPGCLTVAGRGGRPHLDPAPETGWRLLVGPEGGWSAGESAVLAAHPHLGVGPHVLRAVTAALAASALAVSARGAADPGGFPHGA